MLDECLLDRVQDSISGQTFNGDDFSPVHIFDGSLAGWNCLFVDQPPLTGTLFESKPNGKYSQSKHHRIT